MKERRAAVAVARAVGDNAGDSTERADMRQWNVLATSLEGRRPALLAALRRLLAAFPFRSIREVYADELAR